MLNNGIFNSYSIVTRKDYETKKYYFCNVVITAETTEPLQTLLILDKLRDKEAN